MGCHCILWWIVQKLYAAQTHLLGWVGCGKIGSRLCQATDKGLQLGWITRCVPNQHKAQRCRPISPQLGAAGGHVIACSRCVLVLGRWITVDLYVTNLRY